MLPAHADARRGKPPRHAELVKLTGLRTEAKRAGVTVGPSLRRHGVRFVWVSQDGKRRHVGHRPATAREVAARIRELRSMIRAKRRPALPAILLRIRRCESGGNYRAVSPGGRYRGAYQFDLRTWASVGGAGDPAAASPAEQDRRALLLFQRRGSQPWPVCQHR